MLWRECVTIGEVRAVGRGSEGSGRGYVGCGCGAQRMVGHGEVWVVGRGSEGSGAQAGDRSARVWGLRGLGAGSAVKGAEGVVESTRLTGNHVETVDLNDRGR